MVQTIITYAPIVLIIFTVMSMFNVKGLRAFYPRIALCTGWIFYCIMTNEYLLGAIWFGLGIWEFHGKIKQDNAVEEKGDE